MGSGVAVPTVPTGVSRITPGQVRAAKPGPYPLESPGRSVQLIEDPVQGLNPGPEHCSGLILAHLAWADR